MEKIDFLNGYRQRVPFTIEVEPTEGCNLGCSFCGLRGMREKGTKPWKFMTLETAETIASKIAAGGPEWEKCRISFVGHGEPTLNPNLLNILKIFKKYLPNNHCLMVTNGYGFARGIFDIEETMNWMREIKWGMVLFDAYSVDGDWNVVNQLDDSYNIGTVGEDGEPYYSNKHEFRIKKFPLKLKGNSVRRDWSNHCGAAAPLDYKRAKTTCTKIFRELNIRYDGRINLCCDDFRGQYDAGYLNDFDTIEEAWNNPALQAMRIILFNSRRIVKPCLGCSCPTTRAGLIPDHAGKDRKLMPKITDDVVKFAQSRYVGKNAFGGYVERPWEKKD